MRPSRRRGRLLAVIVGVVVVASECLNVWALPAATLPDTVQQEDVNTPGTIVRGVALTPDGLWKVDRERQEGWWEGDLGQPHMAASGSASQRWISSGHGT